ncbi:hypothetical protein CEXT_63141 [Caerostris extrusa]|uniref:Uncharacterized protein n=1 Tax=Caerostris extrusa TaxID=172846 RepID=A0AAV4TN41_CAEEX|nr:hypothetical protein CEXT_63141 [Caerostris extrusa]
MKTISSLPKARQLSQRSVVLAQTPKRKAASNKNEWGKKPHIFRYQTCISRPYSSDVNDKIFYHAYFCHHHRVYIFRIMAHVQMPGIDRAY